MNTDQMIDRVQRLLGRHALAKYDDCLGALNSQHADLLESFDWSRKKTSVSITAVPDKDQGTLSVTNGSATVNGSGTAFTASDMGRYLTIGSDTSSLYLVASVTHSGQFSLGDLNGHALAYPGPSASGLHYVMFTRFYSLGLGIERVVGAKGKSPLTETSEEYLDSIDPWRSASGEDSCYWAMVPRNQNGTNDLARVEIYPRPSTAQIVTLLVLRGHIDLRTSKYPIVPSGPLIWFAAIDMCYELAARTKDTIWMGLADKYNGKAELSLEREKNEDFKKWGLIQTVTDVQSGMDRGDTDFAIDHDA